MHVLKMILCLVTAITEDETQKISCIALCFVSFLLNKGIGLNTLAFHKLDSTASWNMVKAFLFFFLEFSFFFSPYF